MWWILPSSKLFGMGAKGGSVATNKAAFHRIVLDGPPPGLLAYDGDDPVGWCRVTPRALLPGIERSRHFKTELDTDGVWSISCFVVKASHRRRGLTESLARAAVEFARERGARMVEAYPWDGGDTSPARAYQGAASTFRRIGFEEVQRTAPEKPMMRKRL